MPSYRICILVLDIFETLSVDPKHVIFSKSSIAAELSSRTYQNRMYFKNRIAVVMGTLFFLLCHNCTHLYTRVMERMQTASLRAESHAGFGDKDSIELGLWGTGSVSCLQLDSREFQDFVRGSSSNSANPSLWATNYAHWPRRMEPVVSTLENFLWSIFLLLLKYEGHVSHTCRVSCTKASDAWKRFRHQDYRCSLGIIVSNISFHC